MDRSRISSNPSYERLPTSFYTSTPAETNNANWGDPNNSSEFEHLSASQKVGSFLFVATMVFVLIVGLFSMLDFSMSRTANYSNSQIISMHGIHLQSMVINNLNSTVNSTFVAGCNVMFNITNKRDMEYFYDKGVIWVIFDEKIMWTLPTNEFYQAVGETTLVNASAIPAKLETDLYVPGALASDKKLHEWEMFKVRFDIYYRGGVGRNGFNLGGLKYVCNVNMSFRDETTLVGGPSACIGSVEDITSCDNLFLCSTN
ncbi:putative FAD-dependent urate hydroxylase-like [Capsicum annuum]|uniref:uncharacterized protein LOC124888466 n=1 Tax=Capsicum annuum TaxID=4072 RepID=UPI001FB0D2CD|nr:uncharacterized protein LOC124888466 [Capsicum annuum]KAF3624229.1 putative FAD-dependent urate hydroxylase-like [Capsicum annuum]KAF3656750.1 putative FAD-dependent urate hydroxylase-like [Capsicum annuum]